MPPSEIRCNEPLTSTSGRLDSFVISLDARMPLGVNLADHEARNSVSDERGD
jgi:hypothetical protein